MSKLTFELTTPEKVVFRQEIDQVTLPTMDGEITIMPGHISLVAQLVPGVATLKEGGIKEDVAVSGGFIQVDGKGKVTVLADTAERGMNLNLEDIEKAKQRAEQVMKSSARGDDETFAHAAAELERELARYKVALKYKKDGGSIKARTPEETLTDDAGPV
ncbi:MAG: ATP synthase F1 subunit epsilon [Patescibacteria group bacterium]|nr:ATP synthase F1 subunit epsilon [Patescibacteria group bacterium]